MKPQGFSRRGGAQSGGAPVPVRACSACAGDYEDPDRTAWTPVEENPDEEAEVEEGESVPAEGSPSSARE